jgi:hypothetical protein
VGEDVEVLRIWESGGGLDRVGIRKVAVSLISKLGFACWAANPLEERSKWRQSTNKMIVGREVGLPIDQTDSDVWPGLVMRFKVRGNLGSKVCYGKGTCKVGVGVGEIHIKMLKSRGSGWTQLC